jgi:hypothetical protein
MPVTSDVVDLITPEDSGKFRLTVRMGGPPE